MDGLPEKASLAAHPRGRHLVVFTTRHPLTARERAKLVEWAWLVLSNHAPAGADVTAGDGACLLALPPMPAAEAEEVARWFEAQLNRLPVYGYAPGRAWACRRISEAEDPRDFAAYQRVGSPGAPA